VMDGVMMKTTIAVATGTKVIAVVHQVINDNSCIALIANAWIRV